MSCTEFTSETNRYPSYLLASGELELGSAQSLDDVLLVLGLGTDRHDHLADVDTGHGALRFTEGTAHPGLEPERSGKQRTPGSTPAHGRGLTCRGGARGNAGGC